MNTVNDKHVQEFMTSLVAELDHLKTSDQTVDPLTMQDEVILPELLDDPDLREIMAMSDEEVMAELVEFGHKPHVIEEITETLTEANVLPFPGRKDEQRQVEAKLEAKILTTLIQEAILKQASGARSPSGSDVSHQVVDRYISEASERPPKNNVFALRVKHESSEVVDETERKLRFFKRAFGVAASMLVVCSVGIAVVLDRYRDVQAENYAALSPVINNVASTPAMSPVTGSQSTIGSPFMNTAYRVYSEPEENLPYEETIKFLEKIESGEIDATPVEKLKIATELSKVSKAQALRTEGFSEQNTCAASGKYEHVVEKGENLSKIIDGCAYRVADKRIYDVNNTINIGDILTFQISENRMVVSVDLAKKGEPLQPLYRFR